jgi:hypothetical protein
VTRLRPLLPWLRAAGFVAALAIVVVMVVDAGRQVSFDELDTRLLALALLTTLVWWVLLARAWALLVAGSANRGDVALWCRTQALRYLPGGIWAPVSRVAAVDGHSLDRVVTVAAENVIAIAAALALGGAAMLVAGQWGWGALVVVPALAVLAARIGSGRTRVSARRTGRVMVNDLVAFAAYATAAVSVQAAVSGLHSAATVAGAALLAWAAGLAVVITPGGIGVRELAYVGLLAGTVSHADAVTASVTLRAVTVAAELTALIVAGRPRLPERPMRRTA